MVKKVTKDGLPVVEKETLIDFLENHYDLTSADNDPKVTKRIKSENPEIYRMLCIGLENAPGNKAKAYYECGIQITYELLRRQNLINKR